MNRLSRGSYISRIVALFMALEILVSGFPSAPNAILQFFRAKQAKAQSLPPNLNACTDPGPAECTEAENGLCTVLDTIPCWGWETTGGAGYSGYADFPCCYADGSWCYGPVYLTHYLLTSHDHNVCVVNQDDCTSEERWTYVGLDFYWVDCYFCKINHCHGVGDDWKTYRWQPTDIDFHWPWWTCNVASC